jgi:hypothetical protein
VAPDASHQAALWTLAKDGKIPHVVGEPRAVTEGKGRWHVHNGSLSADGKLAAYTRDTDTADIFAISGRAAALSATGRADRSPRTPFRTLLQKPARALRRQ